MTYKALLHVVWGKRGAVKPGRCAPTFRRCATSSAAPRAAPATSAPNAASAKTHAGSGGRRRRGVMGADPTGETLAPVSSRTTRTG